MKKFNKARIASLMSVFFLGITTFSRFPSCAIIFGEPEDLLEEK